MSKIIIKVGKGILTIVMLIALMIGTFKIGLVVFDRLCEKAYREAAVQEIVKDAVNANDEDLMKVITILMMDGKVTEEEFELLLEQDVTFRHGFTKNVYHLRDFYGTDK